MEIINGIHNITSQHLGNVITMGNFDGVHHGHKLLIGQLTTKGKEYGVPSLLVTFEPQPREFFAGEQVPPRLTRLREKVELLRQTGLDRLLLLPFNDRTAGTRAQWITDELFHRLLGAKFVLVGDDFRFGRDREGSFETIKSAGSRLGYEVSDLDTFAIEDSRVSSTRVRQALADGEFEVAEALLGHEYFIMGRVVYGRQLGRQLGVPTANIRLQRYKAALEGVYCVTIKGISDKLMTGIANIGVRPTVDGKEPLLEVHVFDFQGDLYGQLLTIHFKHKLREEQTFESIDALKAQIDKDIKTARWWFGNSVQAGGG
ncbi:MAG: bifunctional riboflavin kinase/FAD synthetase [Pseudomonadota bacterium]